MDFGENWSYVGKLEKMKSEMAIDMLKRFIKQEDIKQ